MKYYKNTITNEVFAFELDGSQDTLITVDMMQMKAAEIDAHINPPPIKPTPAQQLSATDAGMARITEDLIDALKVAGVITDANLPAFAVQKLAERKALRSLLLNPIVSPALKNLGLKLAK
ncbi:MAG: hypothetical protein COA83_09915 [Methylophaga sp.]|nr:MAG: hypothetical protein COA83_09915 [Methylophaga sp.]